MSDPWSALRRLREAHAEVADTCRSKGVILLTAFGSAATGAKSPRDLDLGVLFSRDLRSPDVLGLIDGLAQIAVSNDLDVMDLGRAGPVGRERALVGAQVLFEATPGIHARETVAACLDRMDTQWLREAGLRAMAGEP